MIIGDAGLLGKVVLVKFLTLDNKGIFVVVLPKVIKYSKSKEK